MSQCPPSVSEQVSWCAPVPGSVTIPNSSRHDPTFPLNELQPTAAAGRPALHFLCIPDYLFSFVSLWEAPLQKSPHLFGQFNQPKPGKPSHYVWLSFELHQLFLEWIIFFFLSARNGFRDDRPVNVHTADEQQEIESVENMQQPNSIVHSVNRQNVVLLIGSNDNQLQ